MSDQNGAVLLSIAERKAFAKLAKRVEAQSKAPEAEQAWEEKLLRDKKGAFDRSSGANVTLILGCHAEWAGVVAYNEFADRVEIVRGCPAGKPGEWTDIADKLAADWLERSRYELRPSLTTVRNSVDAVARANAYHPVRAYLDSLVWDGIGRVDALAERYFGAIVSGDTTKKRSYLGVVSRIMLIGPVARIYQPGCLLRTVPVIEGDQERCKSRSARALQGRLVVQRLGDSDRNQRRVSRPARQVDRGTV